MPHLQPDRFSLGIEMKSIRIGAENTHIRVVLFYQLGSRDVGALDVKPPKVLRDDPGNH